jgi:hypothetical protein
MIRLQPPALAPEIFDVTMRGLESGLTVGDIATYGFLSCDGLDQAAEVLARDELAQFDCIPVRDDGRVTGVLLRDDKVSGTASEAMQHLHDGLLVAADEPLKAFLPLLVETPYRLVVGGATIEAIVTASDVLKLPVRLLAFALVTHLEMSMADVIVRRSTSDEWKRLLKNGRQTRLDAKFQELKRDNFEPALIEVADFCDKREVLLEMGVLTTHTSKTQARQGFKDIEQKLRNTVAHGATYIQNQDELREFISLLELAEEWIVRLKEDPGCPSQAASGGKS